MKQVRSTIVRLLTALASAREIDLYLKRFSQLDAVRFAVVKVGGAILRDSLDELVSSLAFLQQVGLTPIVIHGAGPQVDDEMAARGLDKRVVDGLRHTPPEALAVVRRVFLRENLRLVDALLAEGVRATSIHAGVFEVEPLDVERYGLVGRVVGVHTEGVEAAIAADSIPAIVSLGETAGGQILNVNADWAANELVKRIRPYKVIFLTATGGILDGRGKLVDSVNLATQYEELMRQPWLHSGMRVKLEQIHDLLMELPPSTSLSITTPAEMAKELFTHRGSGTLVRRGEEIHRRAGWEGVDRDRLRALLESSFGRRVVPDYFERTAAWRVYHSDRYRAAAVLTREGDLTYMDKLAVSEDAQGEGLGRAIWEVVRGENPELFWRSRRGNAVNDFYFAQAEGCRKEGGWTVFWYGIEGWDRIRRAVERALARPATFEDGDPGGGAGRAASRTPLGGGTVP